MATVKLEQAVGAEMAEPAARVEMVIKVFMQAPADMEEPAELEVLDREAPEIAALFLRQAAIQTEAQAVLAVLEDLLSLWKMGRSLRSQ